MPGETAFQQKFVERLQGAQDPTTVARVLAEANRVGLPHHILRAAGRQLPGYKFNGERQRYQRVEAAASVVVAATTVTNQARELYGIVAAKYEPRVDKDLASWRAGHGLLQLGTNEVRPFLNRGSSPKDRAERMRRVLMLAAAPVALANPNGAWKGLPPGTLGAGGVVDALAQPFSRGAEPVPLSVSPVSWRSVTVAELPGAAVVRRREVLAALDHPGVPVYDENIPPVRKLARRTFGVTYDNFFVVDSRVGALTDDDLESVFQTRGEGVEDIVVPAAGALVVTQQVRLVDL